MTDEKKMIKIRKTLLTGGWRSFNVLQSELLISERGTKFLILNKEGKVSKIFYNVSKNRFEKHSLFFKPRKIVLNENEIVAWKRSY